MSTQALEDKIVNVLERNPVCCMATIEGSMTQERYMTVYNDGLTIYLATDKKSHKVEELESNPNVHLVMGYNGGWDDEILRIEATGSVASDGSLREKVWNDMMRRWFKGPDDPDYVILEIEPTRIQLYGNELEPEVWNR